MPRRPTEEPDETDDWDEDDLPDGVYHDEDVATVPCPYCKREIFEEAQWCPHCENHVSQEDAPPSQRSWFWIVMMLLALAAAFWWVMG
jgi:hypothetical protein